METLPAVNDLVCVLPHKTSINSPSIFEGVLGVVKSTDIPSEFRQPEDTYVLVTFGPDMYNHEVWFMVKNVRPATDDEGKTWSQPVS